jgi:hypothetical protein
MHIAPRFTIALLASSLLSTALLAQAPAPATQPANPRDLEPAVDTSAAAPADRSNIDPAVDTSATPAPSEATAPGASVMPRTGPAVTAAPDPPRAPAAAAPRAGRALDRLELDTTQVTGNRELPRVLYIVPWKRADLGDLVGKPVNSLLDEVLAPVDRDVFKRETRYYRALQPDAAARPQPVEAER